MSISHGTADPSPREREIAEKWRDLSPLLNERQRRAWAAAEAQAAGSGGVATTARATGMAQATIRRGLLELRSGVAEHTGGVRRPGGGRKPLGEANPALMSQLNSIVRANGRAPEDVLVWTTASVRQIARELADTGYDLSPATVAELLRRAGFSIGRERAARDERTVDLMTRQVAEMLRMMRGTVAHGGPVLWVVTEQMRQPEAPAGPPRDSRAADIPPAHRKPRRRWVRVPVEREAVDLATSALRSWWQRVGIGRFDRAPAIQVVADCGRLGRGVSQHPWASTLQPLADTSAVPWLVTHFPPGIARWVAAERQVVSALSSEVQGDGMTLRAHVVLIRYRSAAQLRDGPGARRLLTRVERDPAASPPDSWNFLVTPS